MVPLSLFSTLDDSALLLHEGFNRLENWLIHLFVAVAEHLDGDLYVTLFNFIVGSIQNPREISPVVDFPYHTLTRNSVFQTV
jgi:hypothetical protein